MSEGQRLDLFVDALALIETNQVHWDQETWHRVLDDEIAVKDQEEGMVNCGTAACLCGHVALLDEEWEVVYRNDTAPPLALGVWPKSGVVPRALRNDVYQFHGGSSYITFQDYGEYRLGQDPGGLFRGENTLPVLQAGVKAALNGEDVVLAVWAEQEREEVGS